MKVLMVIKKLRYSGAYKMFIWLATNLAEHGFDVTVFTYMKNDVESLHPKILWIKDDFEDQNMILPCMKLRKIIKNQDPDCSISFLLDANIINTIACLGLRTKSVICERNDPFKPHYYKLKIVKPLFRLANGAVFQLDKVRRYYSMINAPIAVIPNPVWNYAQIDVKPFSERNNEIVTLGRIDIFQKRHDVLIKAFSILHKLYPQYKLRIFGDGPFSDITKIKELIKDLKLENDVFLAGVTPHPRDAIKDAKIFVLSSDFEGIPNALIEAMSIGMPCLSTDCSPGGASLLIDDGINGYLVPTKDVSLLAEKMIHMIENEDICDRIGNNAKMIINKFTEKSILEKWVDYLKNYENIKC